MGKALKGCSKLLGLYFSSEFLCVQRGGCVFCGLVGGLLPLQQSSGVLCGAVCDSACPAAVVRLVA